MLLGPLRWQGPRAGALPSPSLVSLSSAAGSRRPGCVLSVQPGPLKLASPVLAAIPATPPTEQRAPWRPGASDRRPGMRRDLACRGALTEACARGAPSAPSQWAQAVRRNCHGPRAASQEAGREAAGTGAILLNFQFQVRTAIVQKDCT